jgi:hypothetical protein
MAKIESMFETETPASLLALLNEEFKNENIKALVVGFITKEGDYRAIFTHFDSISQKTTLCEIIKLQADKYLLESFEE